MRERHRQRAGLKLPLRIAQRRIACFRGGSETVVSRETIEADAARDPEQGQRAAQGLGLSRQALFT